jgi:hypothetical protein
MKSYHGGTTGVGSAIFLAALCTLLAPSNAHAAFKLKLEQSGFATRTVQDNLPGDLDSVDFSSLSTLLDFGNFDVSVVSGSSTRTTSAGAPGVKKGQLDITSILIENKSNAAKTIKLTLTDTGFVTPGVGPFQLASTLAISSLGRSSNVSFQAFADSANGEFATSGATVTAVPTVTLAGAGSDGTTAWFTPSSPFSFTTVTTITLAAHQGVNLSGTLAAVPEPGILALVGTGLLSVLRRRRVTP